MNPVVIGRGRSFKGLAQYLLHDPKAATAERVGWVETVNLNDADPDRAWRLMAGTAKNADALKEAAGLRKGGGKNTKPAYHYVVTFPEQDAPTEKLQKLAMTGSLKALGMSNLQAMAVQRLDGKPHFHVMVNMINPDDGTTAKLSHDHKKLSSWAKKFEKEHGLAVTAGRAENERKRQSGEYVNAKRKSRNVYEREQREGKERSTSLLRQQERGLAENLSREGRQMKDRHAAEWTAAKEAYAARKSAMRTAREDEIKTAIADVKTRYKSQWRDEFADGRQRLRNFDKSEKSGLSRIVNTVSTFWKSREQGNDVATSFAAATNSTERRAMVEAENSQKTEALSQKQKAETSASIADIKRRYSVEHDQARVQYLAQCDQLKKTQDAERADLRSRWQDYNARREQNRQRLEAFREQRQNMQRDRSRGYDRGFDI